MASEQLNYRFNSSRNDLQDALAWVVERTGLLEQPDYSTCCDPENRTFLKALFEFADGGHSWITFITAVCKFRGTLTEFMNSKHIAH